MMTIKSNVSGRIDIMIKEQRFSWENVIRQRAEVMKTTFVASIGHVVTNNNAIIVVRWGKKFPSVPKNFPATNFSILWRCEGQGTIPEVMSFSSSLHAIVLFTWGKIILVKREKVT